MQQHEQLNITRIKQIANILMFNGGFLYNPGLFTNEMGLFDELKLFELEYFSGCRRTVVPLRTTSRKWTPTILLNGRLLLQICSHKDLYGITRVFNNQN